jgi:hypothetical protein
LEIRALNDDSWIDSCELLTGFTDFFTEMPLKRRKNDGA